MELLAAWHGCREGLRGRWARAAWSGYVEPDACGVDMGRGFSCLRLPGGGFCNTKRAAASGACRKNVLQDSPLAHPWDPVPVFFRRRNPWMTAPAGGGWGEARSVDIDAKQKEYQKHAFIGRNLNGRPIRKRGEL